MGVKSTTIEVFTGAQIRLFVASINHVSMHISDSNGAADLSGTDNTLLAVQNIATQSGNMDVLFDNASTCCLILNSTAERLQLQGEEVVIGLETVNKDDYVNSRLYDIHLVDREQNIHQVKAFGVPKISGAVGPVNIDELKTLFTEGTQNSWGDMNNRPTGEIEFLLGGNYLGLHPTDHECIGNVKVVKSIFGTLEQLSEPGASSWVGALPLKEQGFNLNKSEFNDALCLRYNKQLKEPSVHVRTRSSPSHMQ